MKSDEKILTQCLFFTSNRFSNLMRKLADETFAELEISSSYVYLLIIVNQYPGITQNELSGKLDISPSTCTRFVDRLVRQGLIDKTLEWKTAHLTLTEKGEALRTRIDESLLALYHRYSEILGTETGNDLARNLYLASEVLKKHGY